MQSLCLLIFALLFSGIVYYPLLVAGLATDDDASFVRAAHLEAQRWRNNDARLIHGRCQPQATGGYYQPVTMLSLAIDAYISPDARETVYQFHLSNLAIHLLNVALVFGLVLRLSKSRPWALLLALLFSLHPVQVESVAWITQRMTLVGTTFSLFAIYAHVRYVQTRHLRWFLPVAPLYAAAVLSRPMFIALPVILMLLDLWPFRRADWRPIVEKLPLFMITGAASVIWAEARSASAPVHAGGTEGAFLLTHNTASLIARLFWPFGLSPYQPISHTVGGLSLGPWFDIALLVLIGGALIWAFGRSKPLFAGLTGMLLLTLPSLLDAPYCDWVLSDQYLYAALIVPASAFAAWISANHGTAWPKLNRWLAISLASLIAVFSVHSYANTLNWESSRTLYARTISLHPDWYFGYIGMVESYIADDSLDEALRVARQAVDLDPDNPTTQYYLGTVLLLHEDGRSAEAIPPLERALASDPDWTECLHNLGVAKAQSGKPEEAIAYLEKARDLRPNSANIRVGLGNAYLKVERFASARGEFAEALKHRNDASVHLGLAIAWAGNEMPEAACRHLAAAVAKNPEFALRAGRSPQLVRYRDYPGFAGLIETPSDSVQGDDPSKVDAALPSLPRGS